MTSPQESARAILEERARHLAQVPPQTLQAAEVIEVLIFALGTEKYAVETDHLREVLRLGDCTSVPGTPDFLLGVINLRGQILALFDLRIFFGVPAQAAGEAARIIVLGEERAEFGVLADEVFEVARLRANQVLPPPDSLAGIAREYVRGVTEGALILLDGALLLKDPRLVIDEKEGKHPC